MTHIQLVGHGLEVDGGGRDPLGVCHVAVGETKEKTEEFRVQRGKGIAAVIA